MIDPGFGRCRSSALGLILLCNSRRRLGPVESFCRLFSGDASRLQVEALADIDTPSTIDTTGSCCDS